MRYDTTRALNDSDFERSTDVKNRVSEQMLQVVEKGLLRLGDHPS